MRAARRRPFGEYAQFNMERPCRRAFGQLGCGCKPSEDVADCADCDGMSGHRPSDVKGMVSTISSARRARASEVSFSEVPGSDSSIGFLSTH